MSLRTIARAHPNRGTSPNQFEAALSLAAMILVWMLALIPCTLWLAFRLLSAMVCQVRSGGRRARA